ncbi:electron transport complex subunit RsxE [Ruminococcus sp. XPD3002]|uniref:electron transport complex subunit RsxE n=1 Tax=Ruminococcus sp. XPD3002 TaxID=1452269 RepID=UPI0009173E86|nr:electron transport complex subunit E [Ruminococcus sp.]SFX48667.1 electron transport complex protein RnfE [Ruminococcus flavefaciens]HPY85110.1 electron transport complex subunit E [Ruminococcus flavefaciens]HRU97699.1 electron transport complex subunit E [Ruminococcus sp.]
MAENKKTPIQEITKGIIKENPTLVMLLGMCPTLAVTTQAANGIGMGLATTFVLLGSNIVISALRNVIPDKVRIPSFIVIIASFVTLIGFLLEGFVPSLYESLGIYLTLITVNCIIFGRAEMFASKNGIFASACDAIGMGIGFTLALFIMGSVREIIGSGQWLGMDIPVIHSNPMLIFIMPAGGFFTLGMIIAAVNKLTNKKPPAEISCGGCESCPMAENCSGKGSAEK